MDSWKSGLNKMIYEAFPICRMRDFVTKPNIYKRAYKRLKTQKDIELFKDYIYCLPIIEVYKDMIWEYLNDDEDGIRQINRLRRSPNNRTMYTSDIKYSRTSEFVKDGELNV